SPGFSPSVADPLRITSSSWTTGSACRSTVRTSRPLARVSSLIGGDFQSGAMPRAGGTSLGAGGGAAGTTGGGGGRGGGGGGGGGGAACAQANASERDAAAANQAPKELERRGERRRIIGSSPAAVRPWSRRVSPSPSGVARRPRCCAGSSRDTSRRRP